MDNHFKFTNSVCAAVLFLWFVYWLEIRFGFDFDKNGIFPRTFSGLQGVFFSPFHSDLNHLYNNSMPLLVLLAALQFFYKTGLSCYSVRYFVFRTWLMEGLVII
jgi:hypothetical protein